MLTLRRMLNRFENSRSVPLYIQHIHNDTLPGYNIYMSYYCGFIQLINKVVLYEEKREKLIKLGKEKDEQVSPCFPSLSSYKYIYIYIYKITSFLSTLCSQLRAGLAKSADSIKHISIMFNTTQLLFQRLDREINQVSSSSSSSSSNKSR